MGKAMASVLAFALCGLLVLEMTMGAQAAACHPTALSPCMGPIMLGGPVSPACCARLRAQQPCLCQYARDPSYSAYVNSPRAQNVVKACGLPKPKC